MFRYFDLKKHYSFNAKVAASLLLVTVFLISILSLLIIPKIQEDDYNSSIQEIQKILLITKEQIKLAGVALTVQTRLEVKYTKKAFELDLLKLINKIKKEELSFVNIKKEFEKLEISKHCSYAIKTPSKLFVNKNEDIYKRHTIKNYGLWEKYTSKKINISYSSMLKYHFYTQKVENTRLSIFCEYSMFNQNHDIFEQRIKKIVQNTFSTTSALHKGKSYLFWLNTKYANDDKPLFEEEKKKRKNKYTVSNMSNVNNIFTGNLSPKDIINASNKEPVTHLLDGKEAISWVIDVYKGEYENYMLLLVKTVYKEDLKSQIDSAFLKILPASIISLLLALGIGFVLFKRLFKSINILTHTAQEVKLGNRKIRTQVKGKDDIGNLASIFDSMLDSFENSIKSLDSKVEEKTKELKRSLEEKEILLKEIHHRVKNNLSLTISLIKLQQEKIKDESSKKVLNDIQERIYTMELLHRKLYESTNLNLIDFKEYVQNLVENISLTYAMKKSVKLNFDIEKIYLNVETAMPCGLILNEIITNAYKYAFKNNEYPVLNISIKKENNEYILIIKDNGAGIKKGIDIQNSSTLGLRLINSIATLQLEGELNHSNNKGTMFKLVFKEKII